MLLGGQGRLTLHPALALCVIMDILKDNFFKINSLILTLNYVNPRNRKAYYRKFIVRKLMLKTLAKILKTDRRRKL